eukprot:gene6233-10239_t
MVKTTFQDDIDELKKHCYQEKYRANNKMAFQSIGITLGTLILLYIVHPYVTNHYKPIWHVIRGGIFLRSFVQFHDMVHYAFFEQRYLNKYFGHLFASLTFTSYHSWSAKHFFHHQHFGDLSLIDLNRTTVCTYEQYKKFNFLDKLVVRVIRDPFFFFTAVTLYHFFIQQRYMYLDYISTHVTNFYFFGWFSYLYYFNFELFIDEFIGTLAGAAMTMVVFHLHHEVNVGYYEDRENWRYDHSLYHASTYAMTPSWIKWATCGMEAHMIHHICSKIPCYQLDQVYLDAKDRTEFWRGTTFIDGKKFFVSFFNTMWNTETQRFQSFDVYNKILDALGLSNKIY